jgi:lipoprotein LprG
MTSTLARSFAATVSVGLLLAVSGCSGGSSGSSGEASRTPQQVVDTALKTLDDTSGLSISLTTDDLPSGVTGITSATGEAAHPAAFQGTFALTVSGFPAEAEVIAVDGTTYAKNSLLLPDWTPIDPATYGAPDPTTLMTPGEGFSKLVSSTTGLKKGAATRGGEGNKEILTPYTGTVPADAVTGILPTATGDFDVTLLVTDDDELRQVEATGVFYEGNDPLTYTIGFADYGSTPDITAP